MSKVFIIETPKRNVDISKAKNYGELVYVFDVDERRCAVFDTERFGRTVIKQLLAKNFDPDNDYICIVGAILTISVSLIAMAQCYDIFSVLLFNSISNEYVKKRFDKLDWKGLYHGAKNKTSVASD